MSRTKNNWMFLFCACLACVPQHCCWRICVGELCAPLSGVLSRLCLAGLKGLGCILWSTDQDLDFCYQNWLIPVWRNCRKGRFLGLGMPFKVLADVPWASLGWWRSELMATYNYLQKWQSQTLIGKGKWRYKGQRQLGRLKLEIRKTSLWGRCMVIQWCCGLYSLEGFHVLAR